MRVLQGVVGQAGQPLALAQGLRQVGIEAETCYVNKHRYGYACDHLVNFKDVTSLSEIYSVLKPLADRFDVFHFHGRTFAPRGMEYPALLDVLLLKMLDKKVYFHFRGSEIRGAEEFSRSNPFHYVQEAPELFAPAVELDKGKFLDGIRELCDGVFVVDPEVGSYVPGSRIVPRALLASEWDYVGVSEKARPLVVHAPSRRTFKGTEAILAAVADLAAEGLQFDFKLIEGLARDEARAAYRAADIIIDQLRIGWYGVLAIEGMALGKPVIAYIRQDLWNDEIPILNANPRNIKEVLRTAILSRELRASYGERAREYFLKTHDAASVGRLLAEIYREDSVRATDLTALAGHFDRSARMASGRKFGIKPSSKIARAVRKLQRDGVSGAIRWLNHRYRRA